MGHRREKRNGARQKAQGKKRRQRTEGKEQEDGGPTGRQGAENRRRRPDAADASRKPSPPALALVSPCSVLSALCLVPDA